MQILKLDQSFIRDLSVGTADESLVEMTIQVAHRLGLVVVAEGVEHESIIDVLRQHDCDIVQGLCICRPGDAPTITAWLRAWVAGKQTLPESSAHA